MGFPNLTALPLPLPTFWDFRQPNTSSNCEWQTETVPGALLSHHSPIHQQFRSDLPANFIITSLCLHYHQPEVSYPHIWAGQQHQSSDQSLKTCSGISNRTQLLPSAHEACCTLASAHFSEPISYCSPIPPAPQSQAGGRGRGGVDTGHLLRKASLDTSILTHHALSFQHS